MATTAEPRLSRGPPSPKLPSRMEMPQLNGWDMFEISVRELQDHYSQRHFSAAEYVSYCIEYIRRAGPYLEAIIELDPDARSVAERLDRERAAGRVRGPLHGIPAVVKDNIATEDATQTTAGSWALMGSVVARDATVVANLRKAGVVVLGKANMSEWASLRSKVSSTGYSARGGQVRNPYDLRKTPFASSAGSAVAVSANLVPVAIGTETDSSVVGPAGINGVVGFKPTVGLTSRSGVIPISDKFDAVGTFGRTVADAVAALDAIASPDENDPATTVPERSQPESYSSYLASKDALRGARFGLPRKGCWDLASDSCKNVVSEVLDAIRRAGAEIIDVDFPSIDERLPDSGTWDWEHGGPATSEWTVAKVDAYNGINAYLSKENPHLAEQPATGVKTVEDIVEFNRENAGTEGGEPGVHPAFPDGQPNLIEMAESRGVRDETYRKALGHVRRQTRERGIDAALGLSDADASAQADTDSKGKDPTMDRPIDALLLCDRKGVGQHYAAQAGYPVICIPVGLDANGNPVGLSVHHTAWREAELVRWASAIEDLWNSERGWRPTPRLKNLGARNVPIVKVRD